MKRTILLLMCILIYSFTVFSQSFTEITEGEWGRGVNRSFPAFTDLDHDGQLDLFLGCYAGTLYHFAQDLPGSMSFSLISKKFNDLEFGHTVAPCFTDLDNNGLTDLLLGWRGYLYHYEQQEPGSASFSSKSQNFRDIEVSGNCAPAVTDLDGDGLLDLIIGESGGILHRYEQDATGSTSFILITDSLAGINVGRNSAPSFTDLDNNGLLDMIVGSDNGLLHHYQQTAPGSTNFALIADTLNGIILSGNSSPCFADIDDDGLLDLLVGEYWGNLNHYEQDSPGSMAFTKITDDFYQTPPLQWGSHAFPCFADLDGDGLLDLLKGTKDHIMHFEQDAMGSITFSLISGNFNDIRAGDYMTPCCIDLDENSRLDIIIGTWSGIYHYQQDEPASLNFLLVTDKFVNQSDYAATPSFVDLDNNGLLDLVIGNSTGTLTHYEQDAHGSTTFNLVTENFNDILMDGGYSSPCFTDLDNDGLLDLLVGGKYLTFLHYEQDAAAAVTFSLKSDKFQDYDLSGFVCPVFADINGDGQDDLMVGEEGGGIYYFQRNDDTGIRTNGNTPGSFTLYNNYPNPFNPATTIQYEIPHAAKVTIAIYGTLGQCVQILESTFHHAGRHSVRWDGRDRFGMPVSSGVYLCRILTEDFDQSIKLLLLR